MENKTCSKCKQSKPLTAFPKRRDGVQGLRSHCKACRNRACNTPKNKEQQKAWRLARLGIDIPTYERLAQKQKRRCAICKRDDRTLPKRLAVDHCHATGKVRGLLCNDCNLAIGMMKDDPALLKAAARYLINNSRT